MRHLWLLGAIANNVVAADATALVGFTSDPWPWGMRGALTGIKFPARWNGGNEAEDAEEDAKMGACSVRVVHGTMECHVQACIQSAVHKANERQK